MVATPEGWPVDVDYRVDYAPGVAITQLREAFDAGVARQHLFRARRLMQKSDNERAKRLVDEALKRAPDWDRIWLNAARIAEQMNDKDQAVKRACRFKKLNPEWADALSDEMDFSSCDCASGFLGHPLTL